MWISLRPLTGKHIDKFQGTKILYLKHQIVVQGWKEAGSEWRICERLVRRVDYRTDVVRCCLIEDLAHTSSIATTRVRWEAYIPRCYWRGCDPDRKRNQNRTAWELMIKSELSQPIKKRIIMGALELINRVRSSGTYLDTASDFSIFKSHTTVPNIIVIKWSMSNNQCSVNMDWQILSFSNRDMIGHSWHRCRSYSCSCWRRQRCQLEGFNMMVVVYFLSRHSAKEYTCLYIFGRPIYS